ncbi:zinc-binding dehydrogenase [Arthrobacter sp. H35-D1]|uniref:zinc-binding dehydrogenase n=1 Tax=Arthrobacter sp. H35-D1 TaxID=3046202 RepID=UPI0024B8CE19|nr:zinc-binding dehydrogenase [Arthrobacter sp. H35-D1]MDJ0313778.1 zinc-binding dehydrogenase [Arthrobacter sp. H35-D1]
MGLEMMNVAYFTSTGGADVIKFGELPLPALLPGTVMVRVAAAAVDHVDTFVRAGTYSTGLVFPQVLGRDVVGTVERVGPGMPDDPAGFRVGDSVWANSMGFGGRPGTAAEFTAVPLERLYRLPAGVDAVEAAAVLLSAATAHLALHTHAQLQPGETVFIGGAAGGVGTAALVQAVRAGARSITSSSAADVERCLALGASVALDYRSADFPAEMQAAAGKVSGGRGVDVHLETSGRHRLGLAVELLAMRGRIIVLSGLAATDSVPLGRLYTKDGSIRGFAISNATVEDLAAAAGAVNAILQDGSLRALNVTVLPLPEAAEAHAALEAGTVRGKIVLVPKSA